MNENDNIKNEPKDYISYKLFEGQNLSYNSNKYQKIFIDLDDKSDITIEKILISIFNNYIQENNQIEIINVMRYQENIKVLFLRHDKYKLVYYLLTKIRSLINKYKEKLFELPNIIELRDKIFRRYNFRSHSQKVNFSNNYINYRLDNLHITRNRNHSQKRKYFDYYIAIKNLFCELKNIKSCLARAAPIIEKVFEIPLSEFEKFSIYECEKEDFFNILIKDTFIWYEINKNRKTKLNCIIEELVKDMNNKTNLMSEKINFFKKIYERNKRNLDEALKISKIGSNEETRFPEDAKPKIEMKSEIKENINNSINNINIDEKTIDLFSFDEEIDDYDYSLFDENSIGSINTLSNIDDMEIINEIKENINLYNKLKMNKPAIIENKSTNSINNINILSDHIGINNKSEFLDKKKLLQSEKENFEKNFTFKNSVNINHDINIMIDKNIKENHYQKLKKNKIKLLKNKDRVLKDKTKNENQNGKDKESKKESNTKSSKESEKNSIPNDIDDLVKYITNDDKVTKKKKNRKKNKKNKNQKKNAKEEALNVEDKKENEKEKEEKEDKDEELDEVKKDILKNSINRFKIHKIKFKYGPNWLVKLLENK